MSTHDVTPGEAFDYWQALISDAFVPLAARPTTSEPFTGTLAGRSVDDITLTTVRAGGQVVHRTSDLIARSADEYVLASIQVAGVGTVDQGDRRARLSPGSMAFYDSTRPYTLHFAGPFEQLVVQVPRRRLPQALLTRATGVPLAADSTARLVTTFLRGLARQAPLDPEGAALLAPQAVGLLCAAVRLAAGATGDDVAVDGVGPGRREAVMAFLRAHADDRRLSADEVADGCHLSRRSLFRLFEADPDGLAGALRRIRVDSARAMLEAEPSLTLAVVAQRCGFSGTSQLHRAFTRVSGTTPHAYRRAHANAG